MTDEKQSKRHVKKAVPQLTAEQQAAVLVAQAKQVEEQKAEQERLNLFAASVPHMSHRQLRGELRRAIKREHAGRPPVPQPGLTIALATAMLIVLEGTKTVRVFDTDENGKPTRVARLDQINQLGKLHSYPR